MLPNSLEYRNTLYSEIYKALKFRDLQKVDMAVKAHFKKLDILDHLEQLGHDSLLHKKC